MHHTLSALGLGAVLVCGGWMSAGGAQPPPPGRPLPSPALTNDTAGFAAREEVQVKFHEAAAVMLSGDYTNAIPPLEAVIQAKPSLINAWEALSLCYVRTGRLADAQRLLERLLIIDPTLPRIHKALGQVATMQGDLPGAERYYLSSLKLNPDQYDTRLDLARLLRRQNRPDEALVSLRQLRAEDPQRNDVVLEMAQALLDNQQYAEALPFWQQVAALDQQNEQYQTTIAGVRLHTGFVKEAEEVAQQVLARSSTNLNALLIMADIKEYGDHPAEAVPYLKKIIEVPGYLYLQQQARLRLVMLYVYLHELDPLQYPVDDAIRKAEDFLKEESGNVEMMLMLAELYGVNGQLEQAEKRFRYVLRNFNPHNRRAHNGLFEIYAAQGKLQEAEKELQIVESFNPHNPYRHYTRAQFAAAQGNYTAAYREVDQLEAAGQQGAVAVLLYHELTMSDWQKAPSVKRFREQLAALKKAGFQFITPDQFPAYLTSRLMMATNQPTGTPERVVMVTFDDARREALRLGTAVAQDFNTTFLMHVPVGHVDHDSYTSSWEQMKAAQATGRWRFGSHLMEAHEVLHMESDNSVIHPLANRLWLAAPNRLETENEYDARIKYEYQRSREIMQQKLGGAADIIAYPMGDLGQETRSDMPEALTVNLREAAANYKTGFIQSQFGYAVNGDNPLLYQRHELGRLPGAEAVEYLLRNHPVFLAHRLRAEYAAQEGKIYKSKDALAQLRQDGYPTNAYNKVASYVYERLTGVRTTPVGISKVTKGPFHLELKDPYVGVRAEYLKDNLDSRNWRLLGLGGLNLTPNITVEGTAGIGRMQQAFTNNLALNGPEIRLDERTVGVAPAVKFPNGWVLLGELSDRHFTGKVPTDLNGHTANFDKTVIQYAAEAQIKPLLPLDVAARWEHDIVPSARAALKDTTYNAGTLAAAYRLFDWWDLNASGTRYMFSDSNNRNHLMAESLWLLYEPAGFRLGLRYEYTSADEASPDYWTPYKLNRYYLEAFFRRTYRRIYYNIGVRYGLGKESLRPEAKRKYQEDLQQLQQSLRTARSRRFSPATIRNFQHYIDVLLANPIEEPGWEPVLGLVAATRIKLGGHWELNGEVSYNRLPDYNSLNLLGGIKFKF